MELISAKGFAIQRMEDASKIMNDYFTKLPVNKYNLLGPAQQVINSIKNLDTILNLYDLEEEDNKKNADDLAETIIDHLQAKYNVKQPGTPMIDYELTLIQGYIKSFISAVEKGGDLVTVFGEDFVKTKNETHNMLIEARAAQKEAMDKQKAEYEEMQAKQKVLDEAKKEKEVEEEYGFGKESTTPTDLESIDDL